MTIGYYTDNNVSQGVMRAFAASGIETRHIKDFDNTQPAIFYGILRGAGIAMRILKDRGIDFWYVDNGYFDAIYMDSVKQKDMGGKYRIVKNGYIEPYAGGTKSVVPYRPLKILIMPPSIYSAVQHDTTPEDWRITWGQRLHNLGHTRKLRDKTESTPLEIDLAECDAVFAFNSMGVVKAIEMGKAAYTTHGIIRNDNLLGCGIPYYDMSELRRFYEPKQFTLEQIADLGVKCLN